MGPPRARYAEGFNATRQGTIELLDGITSTLVNEATETPNDEVMLRLMALTADVMDARDFVAGEGDHR